MLNKLKDLKSEAENIFSGLKHEVLNRENVKTVADINKLYNIVELIIVKNDKKIVSYYDFNNKKVVCTEIEKCSSYSGYSFRNNEDIKEIRKKINYGNACSFFYVYSNSNFINKETISSINNECNFIVRESENWCFFIPRIIKCDISIKNKKFPCDKVVRDFEFEENIHFAAFPKKNRSFAVSKKCGTDNDGLYLISESESGKLSFTKALSVYKHDVNCFLDSFPKIFWNDDLTLKARKSYCSSSVDVKKIFLKQEEKYLNSVVKKSDWLSEWNSFDFKNFIDHLDNLNIPLFRNKCDNKGMRKKVRICRYCGEELPDGVCKCPSCNNSNIETKSNINWSDSYVFIYKALSDGSLAYVSFKLSFNNEEYYKPCGERDIRIFLLDIVFFNKDKLESYDGEGHISQKALSNDYCDCLMTNEELTKEINKSVFCNCGVIDAWGLNPEHPERKFEKAGFFNNDEDSCYILKASANPGMELLLKTFDSRSFDILKYNPYDYNINLKAKSLPEILDCSQALCRYMIKNKDIRLIQMRLIQRIISYDENATFDNCKYFIVEHDEAVDYLLSILTIAKNSNIKGLNIENLKKFFIRCYDIQCMSYKDIFSIYKDYLINGNNLNYDFTNLKVLFPCSLKREHDVACRAYEICQKQIEEQNFLHAYEPFTDFEYENESYCIIFPKTPLDVIAEGKNQSHCVGTYISRIVDRSSLIVFLRKKSVPDKSLYTIEIDPTVKKIVQIRGYDNVLPSEKDVIKFIENWAIKKNINYSLSNVCDIPNNYYA